MYWDMLMTVKLPIVMISSTIRDLSEHREGVRDACLRQSMFPKMMEHISATDDGGLSESLRLVEEADVYLGVFGHRYGIVPKGKTKSITHYEYDRATELNIPRLIFIMHEAHPVLAADVDKGENAQKLEDLKAKLKKDHTVNFFKSPAELHAMVASSLALSKKTSLS
jgi:hypothetical protein